MPLFHSKPKTPPPAPAPIEQAAPLSYGEGLEVYNPGGYLQNQSQSQSQSQTQNPSQSNIQNTHIYINQQPPPSQPPTARSTSQFSQVAHSQNQLPLGAPESAPEVIFNNGEGMNYPPQGVGQGGNGKGQGGVRVGEVEKQAQRPEGLGKTVGKDGKEWDNEDVAVGACAGCSAATCCCFCVVM